MIRIFIVYFTCFVLFFSCKKDKENSPAVFVTPSDIVLNYTMGEVVTFKITANSSNGLKRMKISSKEANAYTQVLVDSSLSGQEKISQTFEYLIPVKSESYTIDLYFIFTDNNNEEIPAARTLIVSKGTIMLTEYSGNVFYSKDSGKEDAYDLMNRTPLYSSTATVSLMDIKNNGDYDNTDSLSASWVSPSGIKFVRFNGYDYDNASYASMVSAYESGIKLDTIKNITQGDVIFTKITRNTIDTYLIIKTTSVIDQPGSLNDFYIFRIKK